MRERRAQTMDEFLNHSTKAKGASYLKNWRKEGQIIVWPHTGGFSFPVWNHQLYRVVERERNGVTQKEIWATRWVCHESEYILCRQHFRDETTDAREHPPTICPNCKFIELVRTLYRDRKIPWTAPVLQWFGDCPPVVLHACGVDGSANQRELTSQAIRDLKEAHIFKNQVFKENLRAKLQYLFLVASDSNLASGVQKTYEAQSLGQKIQAAVSAEILKAKMSAKGDKTGSAGNPLLNPYPLLWKYTEDQPDPKEKYQCIALTDQVPREQVLKIIRGPAPSVDEDLAPGNCWELYQEFKAHLVVPPGVLNLDQCFEVADKAGLMKPPNDAEHDQEAEERTRIDFETAAIAQARKSESSPHEVGRRDFKPGNVKLTIGADSPIWAKWPSYTPQGIAGAHVLLDAPENVPDQTLTAIIKGLEALGAKEVHVLYECLHCLKGMTDNDATCPHCGARYDVKGALASRPCVKDQCGGQCDVTEPRQRYICEKCGSLHLLAPESRQSGAPLLWGLVSPPQKEEAQSPPARGRQSSVTKAKPPREPGEDDIPY